MSPCRQNGLLRFGSSILPPLSFEIGVSCLPLTCCEEQFTLKLFDIDGRSRPAMSCGGEELPSETLCRRLQNCIRAGRGHCANTSVVRTAMPRPAIGSPGREPVLPLP